MLPWHDFVTVWAFLAANIASPGPNVLNTIALAMGSGRAAGFGSAAGVGLGIGLWCVSMTLGVAAVLTMVPGAALALTLAATGLLLWFASRYARAAWQGFRRNGMAAPTGKDGAGFATGFLRSLAVNALNPKALTSWLAVLAMFPTARATGADIALLCAGACLLSFSLHGAYTLAFSTPVALRVYLRAGWLLQATAAVMFTGFALRLALSLT
ncbi:LysE family translocator [Paragemmobacter straminiformis]|uniref:LysE family transporter n=1 Tax=Paragemmobacter straminiformis TaxID=2045119 RepID=A0A842I6D5_9RHOB|nr:LysE family transporter [Gemmobacter straminiformis]MBC2834937.1 LysE family transporter [Gemmobacter straminiformis]